MICLVLMKHPFKSPLFYRYRLFFMVMQFIYIKHKYPVYLLKERNL
ncbi:hypothetical protein EBME_1927 [bacterium endosymbiont of Mortierella elongata FMR23-6]|nr:hypothetical protein EBME_1927 [bacterium endosymbiont of Mortierella elongata FMR23-6]